MPPSSALVLALALFAGPSAPTDLAAYRERRARVLERMGPDAVAVVYGAARIPEGGRQDASFFYLTGIEDEGAILLLAPPARAAKEFLFLPPRDPEQERWTGDREPLGTALQKRTGFTTIYRTTQFGGVLASVAARARRLLYLGPIVPFDQPVPRELDLYRKVAERIPGLGIAALPDLLPSLRAVKDAGELRRIRRAVAATVAGHFEAWRRVRPGLTERELKRELEAAFVRAGATGLAYPSIVGSGLHGTVLHARRDDRVIGPNELVVIDAGAEFERYAADVTRTIPSTGRFTAEQRRIYEIVLRAQAEALARVKPGAYLRTDVHAAARKVIADAGYADAFPHGTSHFVGLRVHDAGLEDEPLRPGMVITVEPGIYLPDQGIGVRIEDMVLVTDAGHEVLSSALPKDPEAIERWMAQARGASK